MGRSSGIRSSEPMTDRITREHRSWNMSRIRAVNTTPERVVRSLLHRMGYRFRLQRKDLPGRPDLVLPRYHVAIFVHGCFWHRHHGCKYAYVPKSRTDFWKRKFRENVKRDRRAQKRLIGLGWRVIIVWECETWDLDKLSKYLALAISATSQSETSRIPLAASATSVKGSSSKGPK